MRRFAVECRFAQGSIYLARAGLAKAGLVAITPLSEAPPGPADPEGMAPREQIATDTRAESR